MTITNKTQAVAQLRAAADRLEDFEGELDIGLRIFIHSIPAETMGKVLMLADDPDRIAECIKGEFRWHQLTIGGVKVAAYYETHGEMKRRMAVCS